MPRSKPHKAIPVNVRDATFGLLRAFGIKKAAVDKHPDRYQTLLDTAKKTFADPAYKTAFEKTKIPWSVVTPGYADECKAYVTNITELGNEYRDLLMGK